MRSLIFFALLAPTLASAAQIDISVRIDDEPSELVRVDVDGDDTGLTLGGGWASRSIYLDIWNLDGGAEGGGDLEELGAKRILRLDHGGRPEVGVPGDWVGGEYWWRMHEDGRMTISFDIEVTSSEGRRVRVFGKGLSFDPDYVEAAPLRPSVGGGGGPSTGGGAGAGCDSGWDDEPDSTGCDASDWDDDEDESWGSDDGAGCESDDWGSDDRSGCESDDWGSDDSGGCEGDDVEAPDCDGDAIASSGSRRRSPWGMRLVNWAPWFGVVWFIHGMRRRRR